MHKLKAKNHTFYKEIDLKIGEINRRIHEFDH